MTVVCICGMRNLPGDLVPAVLKPIHSIGLIDCLETSTKEDLTRGRW